MKWSDICESTSDVKWAVGANISHATPSSQHYQKNADYKIIWANIEDLFAHTEKDFTLDLNDKSGGKNSIGARIKKAFQHFENHYMDPSMISYNDFYKSISFVDGRHRLYAAYHLGERYAPVIAPVDYVDIIKKLVRTK